MGAENVTNCKNATFGPAGWKAVSSGYEHRALRRATPYRAQRHQCHCHGRDVGQARGRAGRPGAAKSLVRPANEPSLAGRAGSSRATLRRTESEPSRVPGRTSRYERAVAGRRADDGPGSPRRPALPRPTRLQRGRRTRSRRTGHQHRRGRRVNNGRILWRKLPSFSLFSSFYCGRESGDSGRVPRGPGSACV